jgi:hypothetical protein
MLASTAALRTAFLLAAVLVVAPETARAQSDARWVRPGSDPGCVYGTRRRADGECHGVRKVPVELAVKGAKADQVWLALHTGASIAGFQAVPVADSATAHTRAVGLLMVDVQPRRITITGQVRHARISGRCSQPRVVATTGMVSDVMLGAMVVAATNGLMHCFDQQWSVASLGAR